MQIPESMPVGIALTVKANDKVKSEESGKVKGQQAVVVGCKHAPCRCG